MNELSILFVTTFKNIKYLKMTKHNKDNWKQFNPLYKVGVSKGTVTKYIQKTTVSIIYQYVSLGCYKNVENLKENNLRGVIYSFA